jgi:peroxiredoxin
MPASERRSHGERAKMPGRTRLPQLAPGVRIEGLALTAVSGEPVAVPDPHRLTHLQFRRYAGCPVCDLHLNAFRRRHREIERANVREVVVFHSRAEEIQAYAGGLPFALIADPGKRLYRQFGVEAAPQALLDPRVWPYLLAGIARSVAKIVRGTGASPPMAPAGGILGLPADFLIGTGGTVLACKYGSYAYDQWPVDELIVLSKKHA